MGRLNSKQFLKTYRVFVNKDSIKAPKHLGFSSLDGAVFYMPRRKKLVVQIYGKKVPTNKGPVLGLSETVDWPNGGDFAGMREHLRARLKAALVRLRAKEIPKQGNHIKKCAAGGDVIAYSERGCPSCICWYCTVCPA